MCVDVSSIHTEYIGKQAMQVGEEMLLVIFILNNTLTST